MWIHNTQTTDSGEPHPREIRLAGMTERATFDDHGNAYLEDDDAAAILLDQLEYVEETSEPDYYDDEMGEGAESPEETGEDVTRGPTPEDAGDSFEGVEREEARPAATDVEPDATVEDTDDGDAEVVADPAEAEAVDPHDTDDRQDDEGVVDRARDDTDEDDDRDDEPHTDGGYGVSGFGEQ